MANHLVTTNDQTHPKQLDAEIDRAIAGYQELIEVISSTRTMELPDSHLSMSQMRVLMLLGGVGETRMSDLAPRLGISLSTLSSLVERLVEAELAQRRDDPRDRRNVLVALAPAGSAILDSFQELGLRQMRELLNQLDLEGIETVKRAIDLLVAAVRRITPEDQK